MTSRVLPYATSPSLHEAELMLAHRLVSTGKYVHTSLHEPDLPVGTIDITCVRLSLLFSSRCYSICDTCFHARADVTAKDVCLVVYIFAY